MGTPRPSKTPYKGDWKVQLAGILKQHNHRASNRNKNVGTETMQLRWKILFLCFSELRLLGYKLEDPANLKEKHVRVLAEHWESEELSASTIQNRISILRTFSVWIGKAGMITDSINYVKQPQSVTRSQIARVDKSWSTNSVVFEQVFKQIEAYDQRTAAQLLVIKAFGLRRKEAVSFRPHIAMRIGDNFNDIVVEFGTKGGRPRVVPIETDEQRYALEYAKRLAKTPNAHIGWDDLTITQAVKKFANTMQKFGLTKKDMGVTAHGLRTEFAITVYQDASGAKAPVRGGVAGDVDPDIDELARMKASSALGHSRTSVTNSYYGSRGRRKNALRPVNHPKDAA